jgi:hypothetical protein
MSHAPCCRCCGQPFRPRPQNPTQTYCSQPACQRSRKRDWQRRQRASDPDYRANDQAAQRVWAQGHPQYWRAWRERHPDYVVRNRRAQVGRNARRRAAGVIANEDAWTRESVLVVGTYRVEPWLASDCKCGRVNPENLFLLSVVDAPAAR